MDLEDEVEFVTIMTFDSLQNVIDFQGENYKRSYVPEAAQKVLKHWDLEATHYELIETVMPVTHFVKITKSTPHFGNFVPPLDFVNSYGKELVRS